MYIIVSVLVTLSNVENKDFCCSALDLYKGAENGGFNTMQLIDYPDDSLFAIEWNNMQCWEYGIEIWSDASKCKGEKY